jgi:hypothetical protein
LFFEMVGNEILQGPSADMGVENGKLLKHLQGG